MALLRVCFDVTPVIETALHYDRTFADPLTERLVQFLLEIGMQVERSQINDNTFLPGIDVKDGVILIDESKLSYPGDLLHEAGHLAVVPSSRRSTVGADVGKSAGEEMMAIAWSYAAVVHLQLDASVVFHDAGYKGGSNHIIENFSRGNYLAVPTLQWLGLTADNKLAKEMGIEAYPAMIKWLND
ncbi:MAG: hypothetical protein ABR555_02365 [Pyrinomonadaceae bacterium]